MNLFIRLVGPGLDERHLTDLWKSREAAVRFWEDAVRRSKCVSFDADDGEGGVYTVVVRMADVSTISIVEDK